MRQTCIFSGSSHPRLVEAICERLGQRPANVALKKFANGETSVEIKTSVRDQDVFIVQSGSGEINDNVIELLIMISACKGGSSRSITAVVPYFPYSRQSKQKTHRSGITARMLANLMRVAGVDHVISVDLHASQMQGFFKCPVDNLRAEPILSKWIRMNVTDWRDAVVVSKNPGGTKRVTSLADALQLSFGVITTDTRRVRPLPSMNNSVILERIGTDGTNELENLEEEVARAEIFNPDGSTTYQDFADRGNHANGDSPSRRPNAFRAVSSMSSGIRARLMNGDHDSARSPLVQSTRAESVDGEKETGTPSSGRHRVSSGVSTTTLPQHEEDGYEMSDDEGDDDEEPQEIITGRLVHGHIVDDDAPSPGESNRAGSVKSGSDDAAPDPMTQSFISVTSERMRAPRHGLGGTGDATASDEEEEEALQNPEIETTVTLVGNVRDKPVLIVDDMIDKAGSWIAAAETVVKRGGATKVYCMATHGLFGGDSLRELDECDEIEAIVVTDAFPIPEEKKRGVKKLVELDVSGLLAEAIRRNHHGESISKLYQHYE